METLEGVLELGSYADQLLAHPQFQYLSAHFEQALVSEMLATSPQESKRREYIYSKIQAHREFLTHLVEFIKARNEALAPPPEEEADLLDPNGLTS
jgi:hypothetical protein